MKDWTAPRRVVKLEFTGGDTMRATTLIPIGLLLAAACNRDKGAGDTGGVGDGGSDGGVGDGGDSGGDGGGDSGGPACTASLLDSEPSDGETEVYGRDDIVLEFDADARAGQIVLSWDGGSSDLSSLAAWESDGLVATLSGLELQASTAYSLDIACGDGIRLGFTTSEYGAPLSVDPSALVGRTYHLDLPGAKFVEPPGVGALLGLFLEQPILVGVTAADASSIDTLGAAGVDDGNGGVEQDLDQSTWDFPAADFGDAPYFATDPSDIVIVYSYDIDYEIPIYGFEFEGTFSADGSSIGGGKAGGLGDTRNLGPALGLDDDPLALCGYLAGFGLECEACPDEVAACLTIEAWFDPAPALDGVTLIEQ
jgi:hypothetical protein